jgi:hypothetical protein
VLCCAVLCCAVLESCWLLGIDYYRCNRCNNVGSDEWYSPIVHLELHPGPSPQVQERHPGIVRLRSSLQQLCTDQQGVGVQQVCCVWLSSSQGYVATKACTSSTCQRVLCKYVGSQSQHDISPVLLAQLLCVHQHRASKQAHMLLLALHEKGQQPVMAHALWPCMCCCYCLHIRMLMRVGVRSDSGATQ